MKKLISLSMATLMLAGCMVGCGKKDDDDKEKKNKFIGKWECDDLLVDGDSSTKDLVTGMLGMPLNVLIQITIEEDGKAEMSSPLFELEEAEGTEMEVSWKELDDNKMELKVAADGEEEVLEFEYKDDKLVSVMEEDGSVTEMYLVKVDEFTEFDMEKWEQDMKDSFGSLAE